MRHPTMSVERALQLFDSLIKPIVMFDSEVWGVGNCGEIDKYFVVSWRSYYESSKVQIQVWFMQKLEVLLYQYLLSLVL